MFFLTFVRVHVSFLRWPALIIAWFILVRFRSCCCWFDSHFSEPTGDWCKYFLWVQSADPKRDHRQVIGALLWPPRPCVPPKWGNWYWPAMGFTQPGEWPLTSDCTLCAALWDTPLKRERERERLTVLRSELQMFYGLLVKQYKCVFVMIADWCRSCGRRDCGGRLKVISAACHTLRGVPTVCTSSSVVRRTAPSSSSGTPRSVLCITQCLLYLLLLSNPLQWITLGPNHEHPLRLSIHISYLAVYLNGTRQMMSIWAGYLFRQYPLREIWLYM